MNYAIHAHIIYYVEPIGICHENLLLLLSDARSQEEEENTQFAGEQIALQKEVDGVTAVPVAGKEPPTATAATATKPLQPCPQGRERQLTLPSHAQKIYSKAHKNALKQYENPSKRRGGKRQSKEQVAHKVAWSAVKKEYKKKGDKWVPKKD
jgi:cation transport regulator